MKKQIYIWLVAAGLLLLSACGPKQPVLPTESPAPTKAGQVETVSPTESVSPTEAIVPEPTKIPTSIPTKEPEPTVELLPSPTKEPEPTVEILPPSPTEKPEPTESPTPAPTKEPKPTEEVTPTPTMTPEPTEEVLPSPTEEPEPTKVVPSPTKEPEPTEEVTPEPTIEPETTEEVTPTPTMTPEPTIEVLPSPEPTMTPEEMIQNGWQKTKDITGNYEVFFPEVFDSTEIIKTGQEVWTRYTSKNKEEIAFYIGYTMKCTLEEQKEALLAEGAMFLTPVSGEIGQQYIIQDETTMYLTVILEQQYGREFLGTAFGEEESVTGIMQVIFAFPKDKTEYTAQQYRIMIQSVAAATE